MKIGSQEHKELFCHRFTNSHLFYQPEKLPELDEEALTRLRSIPFWREALYTEQPEQWWLLMPKQLKTHFCGKRSLFKPKKKFVMLD